MKKIENVKMMQRIGRNIEKKLSDAMSVYSRGALGYKVESNDLGNEYLIRVTAEESCIISEVALDDIQTITKDYKRRYNGIIEFLATHPVKYIEDGWIYSPAYLVIVKPQK